MLSPRAYHLKRKFGITEKQYDEILQKQGGCCAICRRPATDFATKLAVDHDHRTGEIRGLLCFFDNKYFIGRHSDPDKFSRASTYLRNSTGLYVPAKAGKQKKRRRKKRNRRKNSRNRK